MNCTCRWTQPLVCACRRLRVFNFKCASVPLFDIILSIFLVSAQTLPTLCSLSTHARTFIANGFELAFSSPFFLYLSNFSLELCPPSFAAFSNTNLPAIFREEQFIINIRNGMGVDCSQSTWNLQKINEKTYAYDGSYVCHETHVYK